MTKRGLLTSLGKGVREALLEEEVGSNLNLEKGARVIRVEAEALKTKEGRKGQAFGWRRQHGPRLERLGELMGGGTPSSFPSSCHIRCRCHHLLLAGHCLQCLLCFLSFFASVLSSHLTFPSQLRLA